MKEPWRVASAELYSADIFLVGVGQYDINQLTLEGYHVLRESNRVLHITQMHGRLSEINSNCVDLNPRFQDLGRDWEMCKRIADYVTDEGAQNGPLTFVASGNALFFDDIGWEIVRIGIAKGLKVQALPGISCFDVLPIQLGFDPGDLGSQIFEATHLLKFNLRMNPMLSTLVLQVAELDRSERKPGSSMAERFHKLLNHVLKFYPPTHRLVFVKSRTMADENDAVISTAICKAAEIVDDISAGMTLYIPRVNIPVTLRASHSDEIGES